MERKFIKGDTVEDNIDSVDLILQSWAPRLGNCVTGIIPPVPILHYQKYPDEEGVIFGGVIPFKGKISDAFFAIGKYAKKPLYLKIRILYKGIQSGTTLECDKPFQSYHSEILIEAGSIIKVSVEPIDSAEQFYIGILAHADVEHAQKEQQLIAGLSLLTGEK